MVFNIRRMIRQLKDIQRLPVLNSGGSRVGRLVSLSEAPKCCSALPICQVGLMVSPDDGVAFKVGRIS